MKAIKILIILIIFSSCSESDSDICREQCYEIIRVENYRRSCALSGCTYNFKVTFKNKCSGELVYKTSNYRPLGQGPKVGEIKCSFLGYR